VRKKITDILSNKIINSYGTDEYEPTGSSLGNQKSVETSLPSLNGREGKCIKTGLCKRKVNNSRCLVSLHQTPAKTRRNDNISTKS
jgi:hypothetical protein